MPITRRGGVSIRCKAQRSPIKRYKYSVESSLVRNPNPLESIAEAKKVLFQHATSCVNRTTTQIQTLADTQIPRYFHAHTHRNPCESTITIAAVPKLELEFGCENKNFKSKMPAKNGKNNAKNYSAPTTKSVNRTRSRAGPEMGAEVASNGLGSRDAFLQAFYSPERFAKCSEIRKPTNQRAFLHTTKRAKQELSLPLEWCE